MLKRIGFLLCCSCHQRGCTFPQNTLGGTNCSLSRSLSVCQVCIFDLGESSYFCTIESPSEIGSDWVEKPDRWERYSKWELDKTAFMFAPKAREIWAEFLSHFTVSAPLRHDLRRRKSWKCINVASIYPFVQPCGGSFLSCAGRTTTWGEDRAVLGLYLVWKNAQKQRGNADLEETLSRHHLKWMSFT